MPYIDPFRLRRQLQNPEFAQLSQIDDAVDTGDTGDMSDTGDMGDTGDATSDTQEFYPGENSLPTSAATSASTSTVEVPDMGLPTVQPPALRTGALEALRQHDSAIPSRQNPAIWRKILAGLFGGASVLAATQANPREVQPDGAAIGAGIQGILYPGEGVRRQDWAMKRQSLQDQAQAEAQMNNALMREYSTNARIAADAPLKEAQRKMYEQRGNMFTKLGDARLITANRPPKPPDPYRPKTPLEVLTQQAYQLTKSTDPVEATIGWQKLDALQQQAGMGKIGGTNAAKIRAYTQQYMNDGLTQQEAEEKALLTWLQENRTQEETKKKVSESVVTRNKAGANRDNQQAKKIAATPSVSASQDKAANKAAAEAAVAAANVAAGGDTAKAIAEVRARTDLPEAVKTAALNALLERQKKEQKGSKGSKSGQFKSSILQRMKGSGVPLRSESDAAPIERVFDASGKPVK